MVKFEMTYVKSAAIMLIMYALGIMLYYRSLIIQKNLDENKTCESLPLLRAANHGIAFLGIFLIVAPTTLFINALTCGCVIFDKIASLTSCIFMLFLGMVIIALGSILRAGSNDTCSDIEPSDIIWITGLVIVVVSVIFYIFLMRDKSVSKNTQNKKTGNDDAQFKAAEAALREIKNKHAQAVEAATAKQVAAEQEVEEKTEELARHQEELESTEELVRNQEEAAIQIAAEAKQAKENLEIQRQTVAEAEKKIRETHENKTELIRATSVNLSLLEEERRKAEQKLEEVRNARAASYEEKKQTERKLDDVKRQRERTIKNDSSEKQKEEKQIRSANSKRIRLENEVLDIEAQAKLLKEKLDAETEALKSLQYELELADVKNPQKRNNIKKNIEQLNQSKNDSNKKLINLFNQKKTIETKRADITSRWKAANNSAGQGKSPVITNSATVNSKRQSVIISNKDANQERVEDAVSFGVNLAPYTPNESSHETENVLSQSSPLPPPPTQQQQVLPPLPPLPPPTQQQQVLPPLPPPSTPPTTSQTVRKSQTPVTSPQDIQLAVADKSTQYADKLIADTSESAVFRSVKKAQKESQLSSNANSTPWNMRNRLSPMNDCTPGKCRLPQNAVGTIGSKKLPSRNPVVNASLSAENRDNRNAG